MFNQSVNFGPSRSNFLLRGCLACGCVPAILQYTIKIVPPVLKHLNIISEEYFHFQKFCFNEIIHTKNKSFNKKTINVEANH